MESIYCGIRVIQISTRTLDFGLLKLFFLVLGQRLKIVPIVVSLAVQFGVAGVAGVIEDEAADAAREAVLVPTGVAHPHQVTVVDLLSAPLAHLVRLLALDHADADADAAQSAAASATI